VPARRNGGARWKLVGSGRRSYERLGRRLEVHGSHRQDALDATGGGGMLRELHGLDERLRSDVHVDVEALGRARLGPRLGERLALRHRERERLAVAAGGHHVCDVAGLEELGVGGNAVEVELERVALLHRRVDGDHHARDAVLIDDERLLGERKGANQ